MTKIKINKKLIFSQSTKNYTIEKKWNQKRYSVEVKKTEKFQKLGIKIGLGDTCFICYISVS